MAKGRALLGLDIGSRFIKIIEFAEHKEGVVISGYLCEEIPLDAPLADVLRDMCRRGGFRTNRVSTAVSGRSVIVRYITMQKMDDEQLRNTIPYEAGKYIPFEVEDVMLDCQRLSEDRQGVDQRLGEDEMRVVLVAVKRSVIDEHVALLEQAGLRPHVVDVDSFALGNAFELAATLAPERFPGDQILALVDVGAFKSSISIVSAVSSYFTREIYLAGNDFTEALGKKLGMDMPQAEQVKRAPGDNAPEVRDAVSTILDDLCHEIQLSFDFFESQFDRPVGQVYVSGGGSYVDGMEEYFQKALDRPVMRWDPTAVLKVLPGGPDAATLEQFASQLPIAVGLAARIR